MSRLTGEAQLSQKRLTPTRPRWSGLLVTTLLLFVVSAVFDAWAASAAFAAPINGGPLTNGKPVKGVASTPAGIEYTFTAVGGQHVTLAITNASVPSGYLQIEAIGPGGVVEGTSAFANGQVTDVNFTPGSGEGGTTNVIISAANATPASTGSFTLTYT